MLTNGDDSNDSDIQQNHMGELLTPKPVAGTLKSVKLSVWRRFEKFGRGKPVVVIGEETPGDGWMLCRTASIDLSRSADHVLFEVANAFASFGLQYVNKVGYLTEVLEDFAAVCAALGFSLPIEGDGWAVYEIDELQPASENEYRRLLREIDHVFGRRCAEQQAGAWMLTFNGR